MCATHLLIMLYLSVKFHQICFCSLLDIAETGFVTDGRTDGRTDGAILICHQKFLWGHNKNNQTSVSDADRNPNLRLTDKPVFHFRYSDGCFHVYTVNPLYNDIRYNSKIRYNINSVSQKAAHRVFFH